MRTRSLLCWLFWNFSYVFNECLFGSMFRTYFSMIYTTKWSFLSVNSWLLSINTFITHGLVQVSNIYILLNYGLSRHVLFFPMMHQYHIHHTNSILFPINGIGTPTQHSKLICIHGNTIPKFILCNYRARKKTKSQARFFYIFLPFLGVPVKIYWSNTA